MSNLNVAENREFPDEKNLNPIKFAGFWQRLGAYVIDLIILFVIVFIISFIIGLSTPGFAELPDFIFDILGVIVYLFYASILESSVHQATLGKMALKIKVMDEKGEQITFARALGRNASKFISYMILLVGFVMIAFTSKKQGLHDMIAQTLVVIR